MNKEVNLLTKEEDEGVSFPLLSKEDAIEIFQDNLEGLTPIIEKVSMPSGGGVSFTIEDESGTKSVDKIEGIIIDHYRTRAYWPNADTFGEPPQCSSLNGLTGTGNPGGDCFKCQFNQWGSDAKNGKGKACKEMHRIFILQAGSILPVMLVAPPTSIKIFSLYSTRLAQKFKKLNSVVTQITLKRETNAQNIPYSILQFKKIADLDIAAMTNIQKIKEELKPILRIKQIETSDYINDEDLL